MPERVALPVVLVVVGGVAAEGRSWTTGPLTAAVSAGELVLVSASLTRVWGSTAMVLLASSPC